ncbi:MAG: sulfate respiration complex hexadecaheme cytochrome HmcA [Acidobacteriota bacterium]
MIQLVARRQKICCSLLTFFGFIGWHPVGHAAQEGQPSPRADLAVIDGMSRFGDLERPAVTFPHDQHTRALAKEKTGCAACHLTNAKGYFTPSFDHTSEGDRQAVMDLYHDRCNGCHNQRRSAGLSCGPVTCGECHLREPRWTSSRRPMALDYSLHYRHIMAQAEKCDRCHHEYDETSRKLIYVKEQETPCRDCHRAKAEANRQPMEVVSHWDCIGCHQKTVAQGKAAGPVMCEGCHDPVKQAAIKKVDYTAYVLPRKRPAAVLVRVAAGDTARAELNTVPFDHRIHEGVTTTCRTCHHDRMQACSQCHTLWGDPKAEGVTLEKAMHDKRSPRSCVGCHEQEESKSACAGCHALTVPKRIPVAGCQSCHRGPRPDEPGIWELPEASVKALMPQPALGEVPFDQDIRDMKIDGLAHDYDPAKFPHRKIVEKLRSTIEGSRLATFFHARHEVMCQGCHHSSPAGVKPPLCGNCHTHPSDEKNLVVPKLEAAYHLQCIGCHNRMGIEPNTTKSASRSCEGCHPRKGGVQGLR